MNLLFLVFTDLDGTLLDQAYSWEAARPAVQRLIDLGIPLIFTTSKTRAETEYWRLKTGNQHPFVVENGGTAFVPQGYFPAPVAGAARRNNFEVLEWGTRYPTLVDALHKASEASACRVQGFHDMTAAQVAVACGLPTDLAELAKQREYDEPFTVLDPGRIEGLLEAIEYEGLRCTRGGRFWHITGANDKGVAVRAVKRLFAEAFGPATSLGLGDSLNDLPLLKEVELPILISSPQSEELKNLIPNGMITQKSGPEGWNEIILRMISESAGDA